MLNFLSFSKKKKKTQKPLRHTPISKHDATEPKARLLKQPVKLLTGLKSVSGFRKPFYSNRFRKRETDL